MWVCLNSDDDKPKEIPERYFRYLIMREMGWNYQEFMHTPHEVVIDIWRIMNTIGKYRKLRSK